jgi:hypothetical protein
MLLLYCLMLSFFLSLVRFVLFFFSFFLCSIFRVCSLQHAMIGASECRRLSETTLATGYDMHSRMYFPDIPFFFFLWIFRLLSFFLPHFPFIVSFCDLSCHCYFLCSFYSLVNFSYFISFSFFYLSLVFIICRLIFFILISHTLDSYSLSGLGTHSHSDSGLGTHSHSDSGRLDMHSHSDSGLDTHGGMCLIIVIINLLGIISLFNLI